MQKRLMATAILLGLGAGPLISDCLAVHRSSEGTGQVLLVPYYTVNGGHQTLLTVVNSAQSGKAIKVRFNEGRSGREVMSFNLYLGRGDVWTANIFALDTDGPANLASNDLSCTVPRIRDNARLPQLPNDGPRYLAFQNYHYAGPNDDAGPDDLSRTREGQIELIEMGSLIPNSPSDRAVTPSVGGVPPTCTSIVAAWTPPGGYWSNDVGIDMAAPSGGLFGTTAIVDVAAGSILTHNADALDGFRTLPLHSAPGSNRPALSDALSDVASDIASAYVPIGATMVRSDYRASTHGIDAVSAVLMTRFIANDFNTGSRIGADTEWVISFPTKRFYVDPALVGDQVQLPFGSLYIFGPIERPADCIYAASSFANLNGTFNPIDFSIPEEIGPCTQTAVGTFHQGYAPLQSRILGSRLAFPMLTINAYHPPTQEGWARWEPFIENYPTPRILPASLDGDVYQGIPAVGYRVSNWVSTIVQPGQLANYADTSPHRTQVGCSNAGAACS